MFCCYLCIFFVSWTGAENITPENVAHLIPSIVTTVPNEKQSFDYENHADNGVVIENLELANSSSDSSQNSSTIDLNPKKIPIIFLHKFNPQDLLRPVQQKWKEIQDLLTYPFHPNYGGLLLLSPQYLWSKLKEKGNFLHGGAHNSIFGIAHAPPEYPFPYRRTGKN